jgi:hypothetical protein
MFVAAFRSFFGHECIAMDVDLAQKKTPPPPPANDKLTEKKRSVRALKRVLIAKAEVRRLRALTQAKCVGSRR